MNKWEKDHYVYMMKCKITNNVYYGMSSNVPRRMKQHSYYKSSKKASSYEVTKNKDWEYKILYKGGFIDIQKIEEYLIFINQCVNNHLNYIYPNDDYQKKTIENDKRKLKEYDDLKVNNEFKSFEYFKKKILQKL